MIEPICPQCGNLMLDVDGHPDILATAGPQQDFVCSVCDLAFFFDDDLYCFVESPFFSS